MEMEIEIDHSKEPQQNKSSIDKRLVTKNGPRALLKFTCEYWYNTIETFEKLKF